MIEHYTTTAITYLIDHQASVVIASCFLIFLAFLLQERVFGIKKEAQKVRKEAKRQKRWEDTNNTIRQKIRAAEKRKDIPLLPSVVVDEDLDAAALHRTLEDLQRLGKSDYDPDRTIKVYYSDKL